MKEEYKEELNKVQELLNAEDRETKLLGVSMFYDSRWVKDIKNQSDYEFLYIRDNNQNNYDNIESLSFFLEDNDLSLWTYPKTYNEFTIISDLINGLFEGYCDIVSVIKLNDFS